MGQNARGCWGYLCATHALPSSGLGTEDGIGSYVKIIEATNKSPAVSDC